MPTTTGLKLVPAVNLLHTPGKECRDCWIKTSPELNLCSPSVGGSCQLPRPCTGQRATRAGLRVLSGASWPVHACVSISCRRSQEWCLRRTMRATFRCSGSAATASWPAARRRRRLDEPLRFSRGISSIPNGVIAGMAEHLQPPLSVIQPSGQRLADDRATNRIILMLASIQ